MYYFCHQQISVQIQSPKLTNLGFEFLKSNNCSDQVIAYPEADMLIAERKKQPFSSFSEWGKGWSDPNIRRQRLERIGNEKNWKAGYQNSKRSWNCPRKVSRNVNE